MTSEHKLPATRDDNVEKKIQIFGEMLDEIDSNLKKPAGLERANITELQDERKIICRELGRLISQQTVEGGR